MMLDDSMPTVDIYRPELDGPTVLDGSDGDPVENAIRRLRQEMWTVQSRAALDLLTDTLRRAENTCGMLFGMLSEEEEA